MLSPGSVGPAARLLRSTNATRTCILSVVLVLASCGGRTGLDGAVSSVDDDGGGAGSGSGAGGSGSGGGASSSGGSTEPDAGVGDGGPGATDGASDAGPHVLVVPCANPAGLQAGSPWPIARRCPGRAGQTGAIAPSSAPSMLWSTSGSEGWAQELVIAADGTVYGFHYGSGVEALGPGGATLWNAPIEFAEPPDGAPGSVYDVDVSFAIGDDGTLYAWTGILAALAPDGSPRWSLPVTRYPGRTPGASVMDLTVGPDGTIYVVDAPANGPGNLYAIAPSGAMRWQRSLGGTAAPTGSPSVGAGGRVFVVTVDANDAQTLVAFAPSGDVAWTSALGGNAPNDFWPGMAAVVADDGTVYAPCGGGGLVSNALFCSFSAEGNPLSTFSTGLPLAGLATSPGSGTVYAISDDGLAAFTAGGASLWKNASIEPPAPIVDGQGTLLVNPGGPGGLATAALSPGGQTAWSVAGVEPVALGSDGTIYGLVSGPSEKTLFVAAFSP